MKLLKRTVSLLLALVMLAGQLPVHTFAEETAEAETSVNEPAAAETVLQTSVPEEITAETAEETELPTTGESDTIPETEAPATEEATVPETDVPETEEVTVSITEPETAPTEETLPSISQEEAYAASGTWGANLTWTLSDSGVLTISGTGEMMETNSSDYIPWESYRSSITKVVIESGVTSIGPYAFCDCTSLTSVSIPSGVTGIDDYAFFGCTALSTVTLPSTLRTIGVSVFTDCTGLTTMTIPDSVTSIGGYLFMGCTKLATVKLSGNITSIAGFMFEDCSSLTAVTIPEMVTYIGNFAFSGCSSLSSITIPENVTRISDSAFAGCSKLTRVTIPKNVSYIGENPFRNCTSLTKIQVNSANTSFVHDASGVLYDYNKTTLIAAPGTLSGAYTIGESVATIGAYAFSGCSNLTSVTIGSGVTTIIYHVFDGCTSLKEIHFLGDVPTDFRTSAFSGVTATATYPAGNSTWGSSAQQGYGGTITWEPANISVGGSCGDSLTWKLENGVLTISGTGKMYEYDQAPWYAYRASVTDVIIQNGVTSIESSAFSSFSAMVRLSLPTTVTTIGNYAFSNCTALTSVILPSGLTSIPDSMFSYCTSLTSITIPAGVTSVGSYAFQGCTGLTSVTIPKSVTSIGNAAFRNCTGLQSFSVDAANTAYCSDSSGVLYSKDKFTLIQAPTSLSGTYTIPNSTGIIESYAFSGCTGLTGVTIGSANIINNYAFQNCTGLLAVYIPDSVLSIASSSGYGGNYYSPFYGCSYNLILYCGAASKPSGWSAYWNYRGSSSLTVNWGISKEEGAFWAGDALKADVVIPDSVTSIPNRAFYNHKDLKSITIPDTVTAIGDYAFYGCSGLTDITLPNALATIGTYGFYNCTGLADITIPAGVTGIGSYAFDSCPVPDGIRVDPENTAYASDSFGVLYNKAMTTVIKAPASLTGTYRIPDGVTAIDNSAFKSCTGLTSVVIPQGAASIGIRAFDGCNGLTDVTIPGTVTSIGTYAFNGCTGLTAIRFFGNAPSIGTSAFQSVTATAYYLAGNTTWTTSTKKNYGGTLTWEGLCAGGHTVVIIPAVAPDCTTDGMTQGSYCSVCGLVLTTAVTDPATGHTAVTDPAVDATCTASGLTEGSHCDVCGEILAAQEVIPAAHTVVTEPAVAAGCTTTGLTEGRHCSACGVVLSAQQVIPAVGHSFTGGACGSCGALTGTCGSLTWLLESGVMSISGSGAMADYSLGGAPWYAYRSAVTGLVIGPDVTAIGSNAFAYCTNLKIITFEGTAPTIGANAFKNVTANAYFPAESSWTADVRQNYGGTITWITDCGGNHSPVTDEAVAPTCTTSGLTEGSHCAVCGMVIVQQNTLPALGHTEEILSGKAPTCTASGLSEGSVCVVCGKTVTAQQTLPALGHTRVEDAAVAATCTTSGLTAGVHCSVCAAVLTAQTTVAALGHSFGSWVTTTAATCTSNGTQRRDCSRCDHYETKVIVSGGHTEQTLSAVEATCTTSGLTEGKHCSVCGLVMKAQETVGALGHNLGTWTTTTSATCTKDGTQRRECTRCSHYETKTIPATGHAERILPAEEATCTATGLTEGKTCTTCGAVLTAQKTLAALGHSYGSWRTVTNRTCTTSGQQRRDCSRCDHYETKIIQAAGHTEQVVPAVAATCTASGLTEGRICSVCSTVLTAQKTVAAKGHTERIIPGAEATCTASGLTEGRVCSVCNAVLTAQQTVPARGHTERIIPAVAATCTASGLTEGRTCSVCQTVLLAQQTVEPTGHDYVDFCCRSCGHYATGSGDLGQNVTWEVDTQTGQLTITGSGSLTDPSEAPWAGFEDAITQIIISGGVTGIGSGIFEGLEELQTVVIPGSVTDIDPEAFTGCTSLTDIQVSDTNPVYKDVDGILFSRDGTHLVRYPGGRTDRSYTVPETVTRIEDHAFSGCDTPDTLYFTGSMPEFGEDAFTGFTGTVYYPGEDPTWDPELLPDFGGITWIPQYDQSEVMSITADRNVLCLGEQALLTAQLNMPGASQILWEVTTGSDCVQLTPNGITALVTANSVTRKTTVTVTARTADGVARPAEIRIDILPQAQSVSILREDGTPVSGTVVWWDLNSDVTQMTFAAAVQPEDAPADVVWSFSDPSRVYAEYTSGGNELTISSPSGKTGTVYISVSAADGSGAAARFSVKFTALQIDAEAPEGEDPADLRLLSGKAKQLTVYDAETGKALTPKQITWSMDEVYAPYASIDAKGKLTAKKVVEKVRVEATGTIVGSEGTTVTVTADIYPAAAALELLDGDTPVNNKTLSLDRNAEPLVLTANIYPLDAMEGVTWTISDKKEAFASYRIEENILTIEPRADAKPGAVTIKVTTNDGSKKTATVKLQLASYAETVTIDRSITELTVGDKAVQLYADVEPAAVTKPGIVWSLKNPNDKNHVNLSSSGKIAPKNVLAPVEVTIVATSKDGMASDEHTITVRPKSEAQLVLKDENGNYVTKTTQTLDVNTRETITLSAHTYGEEAMTAVEWSPLSNKAADITRNADGSLTIRMNAAGSINVTAKAEDGRKATVTIKGVKLAQALEISQKKTGITEGLEIASGKSLDLQVTLTDAANKKVTWSIEEGGAYAAISNSGKFTAAKDLTSAHTVIVRATAADGSEAMDTMEILVRPAASGVQVYSEAGGRMLFSFRSTSWWVRSNTTLVWDPSLQGDRIALDARVYPYYSENDSRNAMQAVSWKSSAPKIADIKNGELVIYKTGSTTITVTAEDGSKEKVSFKLNVVKSITELELEDQVVAAGKKLDLGKLIRITPADATSKKLNWQILEGGEYVSMSNTGALTAKKGSEGNRVRICVTPAENAQPGVSTEFTVTICPVTTGVAIFDIRTNENATGQLGYISLVPGEDTAQWPLRAVVYPYSDDGNSDNDAGQKVIWTSSNTAYAEVEDGLVTLKRAGIGKTVTITATAADGSGKKAIVKIRILEE